MSRAGRFPSSHFVRFRALRSFQGKFLSRAGRFPFLSLRSFQGMCNESGSGSAAKFRGQVAQGSKTLHSVPSFQGKVD